MDFQKIKKFLIKCAAVYWVAVILIFLIASEQFHYTAVTSEPLSPSASVGELTDGTVLRQRIVIPAERLEHIALLLGSYERQNTGTLIVTLEDESGAELVRQTLDISSVSDGKYTDIPLSAPLAGYQNEALTLVITPEGCTPGNAVTLYAGNSVSTGRYEVPQDIAEEDRYTLNGASGTGMLCFRLSGRDPISFYRFYWLLTAGVFAAAAVLAVCWLRGARRGKSNPLVRTVTILTRYQFLLHQLVIRDFKTKYKRSLLGMAWSILNPLLTMAVQYIVFSTIFRSDIDNFPVYLLCGIVLFGFFNEAVSLGMTSVTGNAALIRKVYIPKYIFPVSRVMSSLVNLVMALVPLLLVMLVTGAPFRPSLLLLVFDLVCLVGFVMGMSLLLTTAMTFFQDVQFLWGIVSMLWMYMTPIFYPETIIPQSLLPIFRLNPMYQYITFARACILGGVSPEPMSYLWCLLSSAAALGLGVWVFKKYQDEFILYL